MKEFQSKTLLCAIASVLAASAPAAAQEPEDAIARCAMIESVGDRILCLENALRNESDESVDSAEQAVAEETPLSDEAVMEDAPVEQIPSVTEDAAAPETVSEETASKTGAAVVVSGSAAASDTIAERPEANTQSATETAAAPEAMSAQAVSEIGAAVAAAESAEANIGAEQLERKQAAGERASELAYVADLRVASYRIVPYERLVVELENGQVWRQIKGDTQRFPVDLERNQTVDISQSRFGGGYELRLNQMRRTIRVERVK